MREIVKWMRANPGKACVYAAGTQEAAFAAQKMFEIVLVEEKDIQFSSNLTSGMIATPEGTVVEFRVLAPQPPTVFFGS